MLTLNGGFWLVEIGNAHVILNTSGPSREEAKRKAYTWLGGDSDRYTVTPLTEPEDRVHLDITVST